MNNSSARFGCLSLLHSWGNFYAIRCVVLPHVALLRVTLPVRVVLLSLLCLVGFLRPAQAQEALNSPDAPGTISGKVTNEAGEPLAGINIYICGRSECDLHPNGTVRATTQADGTYKVNTLAAGVYQIQFVDPQHIYATEFYDNAPLQSAATDIPVSGNNITGINAVLELGGTISGSVSGMGGANLTNASVAVYLPTGNPLDGTQPSIASVYLEFGETSYNIGGFPAGQYYVCAEGNLNNPYYTYITECYDNIVAYPAQLTTVTVQAGQTTPDINFVLGENPAYAQFAGRITASDGNPISFANVTAISDNNFYDGYYNTSSDENGYYTFTTMLSDAYTVVVYDYQHYGELATYYGNVSEPADATYFPLQDGEKKENIDIVMVDGGVIQGRIVLQDGLVPQYADVTIYQSYSYYGDNSGYWNPIRYVPIDSITGEYSVRGLPPGTYRISTSGNYGGFYFNKFYTTDNVDVYIVEEASDVNLTDAVSVATIDFVFNQKFFEGSIKGLVGIDGQPLQGIRVDLYDTYYFGPPSLVYTFTDARGFYRFDGLNDGYYAVSFTDLSGKYATLFYGNALDIFSPETIPVFDGQHVFGINGNLQLGGAIAGIVTRPNGQPMPNVAVYVYTQQPYVYPLVSPLQVKTDENGTYVTQGIKAGVYKLCFQDPTYVLPFLCYGGSSYPEDGQDVAVETGMTTANINIILGTPELPNKLYLPATLKDAAIIP